MRSSLIAMVGVGVVVTLAESAVGQTRVAPARSRYAALSSQQTTGPTPPSDPPAAVVELMTAIPRDKVMQQLQEAKYAINPTSELSFLLTHKKMTAKGTNSEAYLSFSDFKHVSDFGTEVGTGSIRVSVSSTYAKSVHAIGCTLKYTGQGTSPPMPATIPVKVSGGGISSSSTPVPIEKLDAKTFSVSFSQIVNGKDRIHYSMPGPVPSEAAPRWALAGCQADVFQLN